MHRLLGLLLLGPSLPLVLAALSLPFFDKRTASSPLRTGVRETDCGRLDLRPERPCPRVLGSSAYYCPTQAQPSHRNEDAPSWTCIRSVDLCNGILDCPNGEDEDSTHCMFHRIEMDELNVVKRMVSSHFRTSHVEEAEGELVRSSGPSQFANFDTALRDRRAPPRILNVPV